MHHPLVEMPYFQGRVMPSPAPENDAYLQGRVMILPAPRSAFVGAGYLLICF
jgi:hypothetical protein